MIEFYSDEQLEWAEFLVRGLARQYARSKICRHCSKWFEQPRGRGPKLFCCWICKRNHAAELTRITSEKRNGTFDLRICRNCGNHFKKIYHKNGLRAFCGETCKKAHDRKLRAAYERDWRRKRNPITRVYWNITHREKLREKWRRADWRRDEALAILNDLIGHNEIHRLGIQRGNSIQILKQLTETRDGNSGP